MEGKEMGLKTGHVGISWHDLLLSYKKLLREA